MKIEGIGVLFVLAGLLLILLPRVGALADVLLDTKQEPDGLPDGNQTTENTESTLSSQKVSALSFPCNPLLTVMDQTSGETMTMTLEEYTVGVVLAEMPMSYGDAAQKAQAVAARTRACFLLSQGGEVTIGGAGDALYLSPSDAVRRYGSQNAAPLIEAARKAAVTTEGQILLYEDQPALTLWHASSGKQTGDSYALCGVGVPYLVSVPSGEPMDNYAPDEAGAGLGMSQSGAAALTEKGADYQTILSYYYPGTLLFPSEEKADDPAE